MQLTGRCLCEAVQFSTQADNAKVLVCHCEDCRRSSGSLLHVGVLVPREGFSVDGDVRAFTKASDEGRPIVRRFCAICGSGLWNELAHLPDKLMLKAGSLDAIPDHLAPDVEIFTTRKSGWLDVMPAKATFAKGSGGKLQVNQ
ncbi:MAG: GFA family protein [Pseudomonadota bacterium]